MKRDFLKELGIAEEAIDKIMAENGRDIEAAKAKYADYDDIKGQLESAKATLDKVKDYDPAKADVEKWKADYQKAVAEGEQKVKKLERQAMIKDYLGNKKFVNELTKKAVADMLAAALEDESSKGKSLDDLFNAATEGQTNIIVDDKAPQPPKVPGMSGKTTGTEDGVLEAFRRNNPGIKIDL